MPEREKLRISTIIQKEEPSIDSTHPATKLRVRILKTSLSFILYFSLELMRRMS
jgi:hypothetical protein